MIAILVPLYGRPENTVKMIQDWKFNTAGVSELLFAVNKSDPKLTEQKRAIEGFKYIEGEWDGLTEKIQDMYESFKSDKFLIYHGSADDITYSKDFDIEILQYYNFLCTKCGHSHWIMYGNDMVHGQRLCTHWMASARYCEAIGYFTPKGFMKHCFTDNTFYVTALNLGILAYMPWVITHHHCWANNEAPKDENYAQIYSEKRMKEDQDGFGRWAKEHLPVNLQKLAQSIEQERRDARASR